MVIKNILIMCMVVCGKIYTSFDIYVKTIYLVLQHWCVCRGLDFSMCLHYLVGTLRVVV